MQRLLKDVELLILVAGIALSRAIAQPQSSATEANAPRAKVYTAGDRVSAPELLPGNPVQLPSGKCKDRQTGEATLSFIVDESGTPRNITFLSVLGNDLDRFALQVVESDRFKPAQRDGAAVPAWQSATVTMLGCVDRSKDARGKRVLTLRPGGQPTQRFETPPLTRPEAILTPVRQSEPELNGQTPHLYKVSPRGAVSAPAILNNVNAEFSDEARRKKIQGVCMVTLIVDRNGLPRDIRVIKSLGYGLDEKAVETVNRYRFKPAMKDGVEPVPVMITDEINFRLY